MSAVYSKNLNVYDEMYARIIRAFDNGYIVYFFFSGGKDSLVLSHALYELIKQNKINRKLLKVVFVDEEAIFPCVDKIVRNWRQRFMNLGVSFYWLCMEFKHYNCFNQLTNDESFICWDQTKRDVWVREMPAFAIRNHPKFKHGMTYQRFNENIRDGLNMQGLRAAESIQRRVAISTMKRDDKTYPIYDWTDNDVWLYIKQKNITIPEAYLYMWKVGVSKKLLRISQFFSIDTAKNLVSMVEFYPGLYERILRREPNAYLAMYYWDSAMFRRSSGKRRQLENEENKDWRKLFFEKYHSFEKKHLNYYISITQLLRRCNNQIKNKEYKKMYEILEAGDPKRRNCRSLLTDLSKNRIP